MSELDFDELDKAVNTLMSGVPKVEPQKMNDVKTLNINSTLPDSAPASFEKLDTVLTQVNAATPAPVVSPEPTKPAIVESTSSTTPLATRRGGRFMDVVHPSSDMKNATPRPASRQGVTIAPLEQTATSAPTAPTIRDITDAPKNDQPAPVAKETPAPKATSNENATSSNDWPDPLDMSGYVAEPDTASPKKDRSTIDMSASDAAADVPALTKTEEEADDELFTVDEHDDTDQAPLTTPFLTDAKVQKRPLGGAVPPAEEVTDEPAVAEEPEHAPVLGALSDEATESGAAEDQLPAEPAAQEAQLPPELHSDLMAVESDSDTTAPVAAAIETPVKNTDVLDKKVASASATMSATEAVAPKPVGPTSITQQYREEPSTSDQENGAIYDTASYHQPLAHPAKQSSGWMWIIWIILLLALGGGGAAALYFLGII